MKIALKIPSGSQLVANFAASIVLVAVCSIGRIHFDIFVLKQEKSQHFAQLKLKLLRTEYGKYEKYLYLYWLMESNIHI